MSEELLQEINDKLDVLLSALDSIQVASQTISAYGFVYVPLLVVVIALWWFFKQFLSRYR